MEAKTKPTLPSGGIIAGKKDPITNVLKKAYLLQLREGFFSLSSLSSVIRRSISRTSAIIRDLEKKKLIIRFSERVPLGSGGKGKLKGSQSRKYHLTSAGRASFRVILAGGVFDLLHVGHLATLEAAKNLGDILVVIVARDDTIRRVKGKDPVNPEVHRLKIIGSLKSVDVAFLGNEIEDAFYTIPLLVGPDVIVLGYDQKLDEKKLDKDLKNLGLTAVEVLRLEHQIPEVKSSQILNQVLKSLL